MLILINNNNKLSSSHTSACFQHPICSAYVTNANVFAVVSWLSINGSFVRNFVRNCWNASVWNKQFLLPRAFLLMLAVIHRMNKIITSWSYHSCGTICLTRRATSVTCFHTGLHDMITQVQALSRTLKIYHSSIILFIPSML